MWRINNWRVKERRAAAFGTVINFIHAQLVVFYHPIASDFNLFTFLYNNYTSFFFSCTAFASQKFFSQKFLSLQLSDKIKNCCSSWTHTHALVIIILNMESSKKFPQSHANFVVDYIVQQLKKMHKKVCPTLDQHLSCLDLLFHTRSLTRMCVNKFQRSISFFLFIFFGLIVCAKFFFGQNTFSSYQKIQ